MGGLVENRMPNIQALFRFIIKRFIHLTSKVGNFVIVSLLLMYPKYLTKLASIETDALIIYINLYVFLFE